MNKDLTDLLTEFDEMGYAPTTLTAEPEKAASEWKKRLVAAIKAENAELRERLDKSVELPCKVGDTLYEPFADNIIREWIVESIYVGSIGINVTCHRKDDHKWHDTFAIRKYCNEFGEKGRVCFDRAVAEKRLAELGGEK